MSVRNAMYGLHGYAPDLATTKDDLLAGHGRRLSTLVGRQLTATYLLWDVDDDTWFNDAPAILVFGDEQLEFSAWRADELTIGWSIIDLAAPTSWMGYSMSLSWRRAPFPQLSDVEGQQLSSLSILEWCDERGSCQLNGFEFAFPSHVVRFFNALDENGLAFDPPADPADRLTPVV